jgi:hypothetical protein
MFPGMKTVPIEACSPYQNNASAAKPAAKPVHFPGYVHGVKLRKTFARKPKLAAPRQRRRYH